MLKKTLLAASLLSFSHLSFADDWVAGAAYSNLSFAELDFSVLSASIGYQLDYNNGFSLLPEVRVGLGIGDDSLPGFSEVELEIDTFVAITLRGQYTFTNGMYIYAAPSYANLALSSTVSFEGMSASASEDESEFGFGAGLGYKFSNKIAAEFTYEQFDETDVISLGLKYHF